MRCDILAGEQRPSCNSLEQIPDLKVIHLRIIEKTEADDSPLAEVESKEESIKPPKRRRTEPRSLQTQQSERPTFLVKTTCAFPKSLSLVDMLKLGKVIKEKNTVIELSSFDITRMGWSPKPRRVDFSINPSPIGTGGFREVFNATSRQECFDASTWVVKKYLPKALEDIELTNQTPE